MLKSTVLIAGVAAASGAFFFTNDTATQENMFETFTVEYGKR